MAIFFFCNETEIYCQQSCSQISYFTCLHTNISKLPAAQNSARLLISLCRMSLHPDSSSVQIYFSGYVYAHEQRVQEFFCPTQCHHSVQPPFLQLTDLASLSWYLEKFGTVNYVHTTLMTTVIGSYHICQDLNLFAM